MSIRNWTAMIFTGCALVSGAVSCVKADYKLGFDVVPQSERFITRTVTVPIENIDILSVDSLSAYSSMRIVVGAVNDNDFGTTRRNCALSLVPVVDTMHWGRNVHVKGMHLSTPHDSSFYKNPLEAHTIHNLHVFALKDKLDSTAIYAEDARFRKSNYEGCPSIVLGTPTCNGNDSLHMDFTKAFAESFVPEKVLRGEEYTEIIDTISKYTQKHNGIFICSDEPVQDGGRIDFFQLELTYDTDTYVLTGGYAELKFSADYDAPDGSVRHQVDTSFLFCFGGTTFDDNCTYYAFNAVENETKGMEGPAGEYIPVEGGLGLKPVIRSTQLRSLAMNALKDTLAKYGHSDPEKAFTDRQVVINRATINLPYEFPEDYTRMKLYPRFLNPTVRISNQGSVTYAGLSDASVSTENQGEIDRSNNCYHPDISYHMQSICQTKADDATMLEKQNVWFMILSNETIITKKTTSSEEDYYNQMAYLNYYNSMMGGYGGYGYGGYGYGYGGYGGYGGYDSYSNYYNYYMMQSYYNSLSSGSSSTVTTMMDKDRYFKALLNGPKAKNGNVPTLSITYSIVDVR